MYDWRVSAPMVVQVALVLKFPPLEHPPHCSFSIAYCCTPTIGHFVCLHFYWFLVPCYISWQYPQFAVLIWDTFTPILVIYSILLLVDAPYGICHYHKFLHIYLRIYKMMRKVAHLLGVARYLIYLFPKSETDWAYYWSFHNKVYPPCDVTAIALLHHLRGYTNKTGFYFRHIREPIWSNGDTILLDTILRKMAPTIERWARSKDMYWQKT